ncbi:hypothetical protein K440DRAFT_646255 [Wilcoxina mikolae CBS 423.85]|nr:hypothetical protein K440DRAFT_646255 [Wilcoxina mikolae CBS 423.85]
MFQSVKESGSDILYFVRGTSTPKSIIVMAQSTPEMGLENLAPGLDSITTGIRTIHAELGEHVNGYYAEKNQPVPHAVKEFQKNIFEASGDPNKEKVPVLHVLNPGRAHWKEGTNRSKFSDHLARNHSDLRGLWKELLAALIVTLRTDPEKYIPTIFPPEDPQLRPYRSELNFPNALVRTGSTISSQNFVWFRDAPVLHPAIKLLRLGSTRYYTHRAIISEFEVHITHPNRSEDLKSPNQWEVIFIFSSTDALVAFSESLVDTVRERSAPMSRSELASKEEIGEQAQTPVRRLVFQHLITQVLEDSLEYLRYLAVEIDKAKHNGVRRPRRTIIEFLILAGSCLRELPDLLHSAATGLHSAEASNQHNVTTSAPSNKQNSAGPGTGQSSTELVVQNTEKYSPEPGLGVKLQYLKEVSEDLLQEANHIAVGQMERTRYPTILASVFIPLSFVTSFFAMPFNAVKDPIVNNHPKFPGLGLFVVAIPITLATVIIPMFFSKII